jgi:hypothetical protein
MEKYRRFADSATGVNPFIPLELVRHRFESGMVRALRRVCLGMLTLLRFPLVVVSFGIAVVLDEIFRHIPLFHRGIVYPVFVAPILRFCLLISGIIIPIRGDPEDFRRLKLKRSSSCVSRPPDVIISSFSGPVDVMVHSVISRPDHFIFVALDGKYIHTDSIFQAIRVASRLPLPVGSSSSLAGHGLSVLFPSSVPTNGEGLVSWKIEKFEENKKIQINSINLSKFDEFSYHSLIHTHILLILLYSMVFNSYQSLDLVTLPEPIECPDIPTIRSLMCRLHRRPSPAVETDISPELLIDFRFYWNETQNKKYL